MVVDPSSWNKPYTGHRHELLSITLCLLSKRLKSIFLDRDFIVCTSLQFISITITLTFLLKQSFVANNLCALVLDSVQKTNLKISQFSNFKCVIQIGSPVQRLFGGSLLMESRRLIV